MPRITDKPLADLCRRWATSESAGVDLRKSWQREAASASRAHSNVFRQISDGVAAGDAVGDVIASTGNFFPPLFRAVVAVGEKTGQLASVLERLADHYENRVRLRRAFIASITWPAIQLVAAIVIVGAMIWAMGFIADLREGEPIDVLGLGLVGGRGAMIYFSIVATIFACGYGLYRALRSEAAWTGGLQQLLVRLPVVGKVLQTMAISRFAWSLGLASEAGMDIESAVRIAFSAAQNSMFSRHADQVVAQIAAGSDLTTALAATGEFPEDFLANVETGELSGKLPESLLHLSEQYQNQARAALSTLTTIAGFIVWALIALLIIMTIVQVFRQAYLKPIQDVLDTMP